MEHFGVRLIDKDKSLKLVRNEFALINTKPSLPFFESLSKKKAYANESGSEYAESWCVEYRELCLKNYDLNMNYFDSLDKDEFDAALEHFISKYKRFEEISNLNDFDNAEGYYIMVLGEYKQVYIGKTSNIKRRILQHWSKTRPFDRTLFPMYAWNKSVFSIDFFRALDTTRIFAWERKLSNSIESKLIKDFPPQFCTNRIGGDVSQGIEALSTMKTRQYPTQDE